jgi:hypothetical protein
MSSINNGTIVKINLKDNDVNTVYSIQVKLTDSFNTLVEAYPIDTNIKRIPIKGEQVLVIATDSERTSTNSNGSKFYYLNPIPVHNNIHNNALPRAHSYVSQNQNSTYETSTGNPTTSTTQTSADLGDGFVERTDIAPLQPFIGDVLLEGRFGHSLRFGYTPQNSDTTEKPSWSSTTPEDPITILSNGRKQRGSFNKFIIEDTNNDLSTIILTSSQKIPIKTSQRNLGMGVTNQSQFTKPTIILSSDRLLFNSIGDSIILSSKKTVNVATQNWAADMDKVFTILEGVIQQLADLTSGTATFATGVGPTGPATNVAQVQQLLTQLKQMTQ